MEIRSCDEIDLNRRSAMFALFSLGVAASVPVSGEERDSTDNSSQQTLDAKVAHFLANRERPNPRTACQKLYSNLSRDELNRLQKHEQPDVAMRAAWEFVRRDGASRANVDEFLEVTRQALGMQPPQWWEKAIQTAKVKPNNPHALEMNTKLFPKYRIQSEEWYLQSHQKLQTKNRQTRLVSGKNSMAISANVIERQKGRNSTQANCLVAVFSDTASFLCGHMGLDSFFPLYRIEPVSGVIIWEAVVWVGASSIVRTGATLPTSKSGDYAVTLLQNEDHLFVFGADSIQAHVELFRIKDGIERIRFCTLV